LRAVCGGVRPVLLGIGFFIGRFRGRGFFGWVTPITDVTAVCATIVLSGLRISSFNVVGPITWLCFHGAVSLSFIWVWWLVLPVSVFPLPFVCPPKVSFSRVSF
jgi:hypothetical protein